MKNLSTCIKAKEEYFKRDLSKPYKERYPDTTSGNHRAFIALINPEYFVGDFFYNSALFDIYSAIQEFYRSINENWIIKLAYSF